MGVSNLQHLCVDASTLETNGSGGIASVEKKEGKKVV